MVSREEFLQKHWSRYPTAEANWWDVGRAIEIQNRNQDFVFGPAYVCGRIKKGENMSAGEWLLCGSGCALKFSFVTPLRPWNRDLKQGVPQLEPSEGWLRPGDLLCLRLNVGADRRYSCDSFLLLAPNHLSEQKEQELFNKHFDYDMSVRWSRFAQAVRGFFLSDGFVEALTPTLVASPGTEPFLDPFQTEFRFGRHSQAYFLPTSPEFHLKKMLAAGWNKIFEIKTCFRNSELGAHHQPEFSMLEWYRAYRNPDSIADDVNRLIQTLVATLTPEAQVDPLRSTTMAELFAREFHGFELSPATSLEELQNLAYIRDIHFAKNDTWDELFHRIFLERIEPGLGLHGPILVRDYPPSQAALARIGDSGFADRFEIYWKNLEIANAFHELNDPELNRKRFTKDLADRSHAGAVAVPVDQDLLRAFDGGMPPAAGIALGLDRLFMAIYDLTNIESTRMFPIRR